MSGLNKVMLIGNLGANPESRQMPSGGSVANLSLATSEKWSDKTTGEKKEKTEWHRVVLFDRLAEIAQQYLSKGSKVYVEGRIQTRKWQGQDGQDKYTTEIVGAHLQMLDTKHAQEQAKPQNDYRQAQQQQQAAQQYQKPQLESKIEFDDDMPF